MRKYYKITFSSKIDHIGDNVINSSGGSASVCSISVMGVNIPTSISTISENAFYECENIQGITVGEQVYNRPEERNEIPIRIGGRKFVEKIKEKEIECTVFPFELKTPLCPEDKE